MQFLVLANWSDGLVVGLLGFVLRATVLLAAAWLATKLLHRSSAATRHLIWTVAIAGVLALPALSATIPAWRVPVATISARVEPRFDVAPVAAAASGESAVPRPAVAESQIPTAPTPVASVAATSERAGVFTQISAQTALLASWALLSLLMLLRLAIASLRVSSWRRSSTPVEDARWLTLLHRLAREYGIARPVLLLENGRTDIPVTWGTVYPVILLPATADDWDEEQRVAVLTHELAHIKRFDALSQLFGQIALAVLWFHPLVWVAVRSMRLEREHACDDFVLASGTRASRYADDLLALARQLMRPTAPAAAALAMARRSELEGRLLSILDPATKRTAVRRARVGVLAVAVLVLAIPLAAFSPTARVRTEPRVAPTAAESQSGEKADVGSDAGFGPLRDALAELDNGIARVAVVPRSSLDQIATAPRILPILADTEPVVLPADLETLIAVTREAKRMTSDFEKGQLLALVVKRYVPSDTLREAYIDAVASMTSDHERSKALIALLDRDSLPTASTARVLRSSLMMSSDMNRGQVLRRISPATFADTGIQRAYLNVLVGMSSNYERSAAISSLVRQRPLSPAVQLGLIRVISAITSNTEKASTLLLFVRNQGIADDTVRRQFLRAAETLTSDSDYRRVVAAVVR